eukprot:SAG11_NODE_86_length_17300_cov_11.466717_9_plen_94_part_00
MLYNNDDMAERATTKMPVPSIAHSPNLRYFLTWFSSSADPHTCPMLADGSIMGVNLGDELCWSCLPYSNLSAAVNLVRRDLPRGTAILYYNEA